MTINRVHSIKHLTIVPNKQQTTNTQNIVKRTHLKREYVKIIIIAREEREAPRREVRDSE